MYDDSLHNSQAGASHIPALQLPEPVLTTFRKVNGLGPDLRSAMKPSGVKKAVLKVRWSSSVKGSCE